ncbi:MAG: M48 family metallopeptidase, partial [Verrucomicrobiota bacterium]
MTASPYFIVILLILVGFYVLDLVANLLNLKALDSKLPDEFSDTFDVQKYSDSQRYTRTTTLFGLVESTLMLVALLAFWWLKGFQHADAIARSFDQGPIVTGLICLSILMAANSLLSLPFEIYDTFVIEKKFGFNKTTFGTFVGDRLKGLALMLLLGLPLTAIILYFFENTGPLGWLYGWLIVSGFSLLLAYLVPQYILPLFNKFSPMEDGDLKQEIYKMSEKAGFPLREISIMDGSKRSTKSNAFFTGFGKNKKIALFDTLIENHTVPELVSVLAHEIGHFKKKHILFQMVFGILQTGLLFFLVGLFLNNADLFKAFGVEQTSVYLSLVFFGFLFQPVSRILAIVSAIFSRKFEFQADAYAAEVTGQ